MLEELKEIENEHAHEGLIIAKERFKNFLFRYRIMKKLQRIKEFDKESYDFTKASLEL